MYLPLDSGHEMYYEEHGKPHGIPVVFVLGGPGLSVNGKEVRFFDLNKYRVILYDQRACGRSKYKDRWHQNTTPDLIEDIRRLLDHLQIDQSYLFGGSWGSTLSLLFAIQYPQRVKGLILRGIFTGAKWDRAHMEDGGNAKHFPKEWQRFLAKVPPSAQGAPSTYYYKKILNSPALRDDLAFELMLYAQSIASLNPGTSKEVEGRLKQSPYLAKAEMLAYYSVNEFFIPDEYIYQKASQLSDIDIQIVHGQYDAITPLKIAERLQACIPHATLHVVEAGHIDSEPAIEEKLKEILQGLQHHHVRIQ
jgi:proline iminopeptidase